jgi:nitrogen-specific signal transduction histidine kinase
LFTTKAGGMGMGLSICRSIIEDHGGKIWVSAAARRGAIFQFELPMEAGKAGVGARQGCVSETRLSRKDGAADEGSPA